MLLSGIWVLFQDLSSVTSVSNNLLMLEHTIFIILSKEEKFGGLSYIYNFFFFLKIKLQSSTTKRHSGEAGRMGARVCLIPLWDCFSKWPGWFS